MTSAVDVLDGTKKYQQVALKLENTTNRQRNGL